MPRTSESATRRRTRQAIVDAAIGVLVRDRDATLADVAAAAETSRSTVHRIFADRASLVEAAVRDSLDAVAQATAVAAVEVGPPLDALRRLVAAYLNVGDRIRFLFGDPALATAHPAITEFASADGPVIGLIERGRASGALDPGSSAAWIERVVWALVYTGAEAVDDGALAPHEALPTILRTLERGVTP